MAEDSIEKEETFALERSKDKLWGFFVESKFVVLPKIPLVRAGHHIPPFDVTMPDGSVRHVMEMDAKHIPNTMTVEPLAGEVPFPSEPPPSETPSPEVTVTNHMVMVSEPPTSVSGASITSPPKTAAPAPHPMKPKHKIELHTASKVRHASIVRDQIKHWPEVELVSRWPFSHLDDSNGRLWPDCASHSRIFWQRDEEDIQRADIVLIFADQEDVLRGGLVEVGMGIGFGKQIIVVGENPSYSSWKHHPAVSMVANLEQARSLLALMALDMKG